MRESEFRRRKASIWRRKEREFGVRVPSDLKPLAEQHYSEQSHDPAVDLRDFEDAVDEFIGHDLPLILAYAQAEAANPHAEKLPDSVKLRGQTRIYEKPFKRRLRILDFVAQRAVPFAYLLQRELSSAGRRIDWKSLCAEWNKAHPNDEMTPEQLRVMYERARREEYLVATYFDGKFRDWAKQAESLRPTLSHLEASGLRPEDVFVESIDHHNARLAGDARRMRAEALALRRGSEADGTDSATRARNETRAKTLEGAARTLTRLSQVKKWSVVSAKLPPAAGLALKRAVRRKCGLTESIVAYPRVTVFCERAQCHRCRIGADLVRERLIAAPGGLRPTSAKGAAQRHRERLDASAAVMQKLVDSPVGSGEPGDRRGSG